MSPRVRAVLLAVVAVLVGAVLAVLVVGLFVGGL